MPSQSLVRLQFDVMMVPPPESVNFKDYGLKHTEKLAERFYNESSLRC